MIKCNTCGRLYIYDRSKGHNTKTCNSCVVNMRRFKLKKKTVEYKGGKCQRCGYDKCMEALEFHHVNPKEKSFQISGAHCRNWVSIEKELNKCIMLCANCHRELEHGCWDLKDITMKKKLKHKKHNNGP